MSGRFASHAEPRCLPAGAAATEHLQAERPPRVHGCPEGVQSFKDGIGWAPTESRQNVRVDGPCSAEGGGVGIGRGRFVVLDVPGKEIESFNFGGHRLLITVGGRLADGL